MRKEESLWKKQGVWNLHYLSESEWANCILTSWTQSILQPSVYSLITSVCILKANHIAANRGKGHMSHNPCFRSPFSLQRVERTRNWLFRFVKTLFVIIVSRTAKVSGWWGKEDRWESRLHWTATSTFKVTITYTWAGSSGSSTWQVNEGKTSSSLGMTNSSMLAFHQGPNPLQSFWYRCNHSQRYRYSKQKFR